MTNNALQKHKEAKGKIEVTSRVPLQTKEDLSTYYTPGVGRVSMEVYHKPETVYDYTSKGNLIAVVSDGTAVLGLGDIGPFGAMPVMEGKSVLFKAFGDVDAFPICLDTKDPEEIIQVVKAIAPTFGGINLEDISAPRCTQILERLTEELDIPVFHDDQHGTAIVVLAALINALKLVNKDKSKVKVVVNGTGAAGSAIIKMLYEYGITHIMACNSKGILSKNNKKNDVQKGLLKYLTEQDGTLKDAMVDSDIFIGVSQPNVVTKEMVASMKEKAICLPMSNPDPEILPQDALDAGAYIVGTGRSDFPNQVNNVLAFPGIFRGALDARAKITNDMMIAAAHAIADYVNEDDLNREYILPSVLDKQVSVAVAKAVYNAAKAE